MEANRILVQVRALGIFRCNVGADRKSGVFVDLHVYSTAVYVYSKMCGGLVGTAAALSV